MIGAIGVIGVVIAVPGAGAGAVVAVAGADPADRVVPMAVGAVTVVMAMAGMAAATLEVPRPIPVVLPMTPAVEARLDKWLWCVRLFKTRSLAATACNTGRILVNGQPAKPARTVRPGDLIVAPIAGLTRTVKVIAPLESRIGAKLVPKYLEDLTPAEEFQKPHEQFIAAPGRRPKGSGRPTKRDRRVLSSFFGDPE